MNIYERLTENFHRWEQRGRGTLLHPSPVQLEPPYIPFPGHRVKFEGTVDDGSRPTFLSRFGEKVARALQLRNTPSAPQREEPCEPEPDWFGEEDALPIELRILLPSGVTYSSEVVMNFVTTLSELNAPVALEIIGTEAAVWLQIVCRLDDAEVVTQQIEALFPEADWEGSQTELESAWNSDDSEREVLDFGLAREFMFPLALGSV